MIVVALIFCVFVLLIGFGAVFLGVRKKALALMLLACSITLPLACLELYFGFVHDQSDGFNLTYSSRKWFARHWNPINSLGFRDMEPAPPSAGQKALMILGDSFAAGHGINEASRRFGDILARDLAPRWRVYTVSQLGWDTTHELAALKAYPVKPDMVILGYVINDIYHAARARHYDMPFNVRAPVGFTGYLVRHSALIDYLYWRLARMGNMAEGTRTFWSALKEAYDDPAVWREHISELSALARYCQERDIKLLVAVFPHFQDVAGSAPLSAKVTRACRDLGLEAVDLSPYFRDCKTPDMVVNANDAHPNEKAHEKVAAILLPYVNPTPPRDVQ